MTTFLCLWLAVFLTNGLEQYVAYFFILSIGILHGSNDIKIIKKVYGHKKLSIIKTISLYVFVVLLGSCLFYYIPIIGLSVFMLISSYHFGEQHFSYEISGSLFIRRLLFFSYGCSVIFLLLFTNTEESILVIEDICGFKIAPKILFYTLCLSFTLLVLSAYCLRKKIKNPLRELFNMLVFFIVFKTATLIWAFAIYFVLWHSLPSLIDQIKYLSGDVNRSSLIAYIKSSFLYWFMAVLSLFLFFTFIIKDDGLFLAIFFSFLAAITFPHVVVMSKIFKH